MATSHHPGLCYWYFLSLFALCLFCPIYLPDVMDFINHKILSSSTKFITLKNYFFIIYFLIDFA